MDYTWDETKPGNTELISGGDDAIRDLKKAIRERFNVEHYFDTGNEVDVGKHRPETDIVSYISCGAITFGSADHVSVSATTWEQLASIPIVLPTLSSDGVCKIEMNLILSSIGNDCWYILSVYNGTGQTNGHMGEIVTGFSIPGSQISATQEVIMKTLYRGIGGAATLRIHGMAPVGNTLRVSRVATPIRVEVITW